MSNTSSDAIVSAIIRREGGLVFTNRPSDRGGPTFAGITQHTWDDYIAHDPANASTRDVASLTEPMVRKFYAQVFVEPFAARLSDLALVGLMVDCAVCHGPSRAVNWLQSAVQAQNDGRMGPATAALANKTPGAYADVLRTRFKFLARIATDQIAAPGGDPDAVNLAGWINRACEFIR